MVDGWRDSRRPERVVDPRRRGDYTVWRNGLGGQFIASDYDVWKRHFGLTECSAGISSKAVPEPSNLALPMSLGIGILAQLRRRLRRLDRV